MSCKKVFWKILTKIPPIFVFILIIWLYYSYVYQFCVVFLSSLLTKKTVYITVYHIILVMFVWSYLSSLMQQHPPIPEEYRLTQEEHDKLLTFPADKVDEILKKIVVLRMLELHTCTDLNRIRYCRHCHHIKPDRTHHCTACGICVLKMDHHCPWIANCVGYANYKHFILMVFYATLWCALYVGTVAEYAFILWKDVQSNFNKLHISMGFLAAGVIGILSSVLFFYHLGLLCKNETTLEAFRETYFMNENLTFHMGTCNGYEFDVTSVY